MRANLSSAMSTTSAAEKGFTIAPLYGLMMTVPSFSRADLAWENTSTGQRCFWLLKNGVRSGIINLPTTPVAWHSAGVGDVNGGGNADLVWENTSSGQRCIWNLPTTPVAWHIAGVGDFRGDGNADLVWENTSTGQRC